MRLIYTTDEMDKRFFMTSQILRRPQQAPCPYRKMSSGWRGTANWVMLSRGS